MLRLLLAAYGGIPGSVFILDRRARVAYKHPYSHPDHWWPVLRGLIAGR